MRAATTAYHGCITGFVHATLAAVAFGVAAAAAPPGAEAPCPSAGQLLDRAGRYLEAVERQLAILVGDEQYRQFTYWGRSPMVQAERSLASDVAWLLTGDALVWAFYRDVRSVDGRPVSDRGARLDALFPEGAAASASDRERALRILDESSRYNLGQRRTVNSPTLALTLLHPRNRARSSFEAVGEGRKQDVQACRLRYVESRRPTLVRSPGGDDRPARGTFWIEPGSGAVVSSTLELEVKGSAPVRIETSFAHEAALGAWLPVEMKESYGSSGGQRVEAVARYSAWRRARVDIEVVIPKP